MEVLEPAQGSSLINLNKNSNTSNNNSNNNNNNDSNNNNNSGGAGGGKEGHKKRKRSKKTQDLSCPMKILDSVLAKASYKVPNLSTLVEKKFHALDYSQEVADLLSDIDYRSTVAETTEISVFPSDFNGKVNVPPGAIMSLTCINEVPPKRLKWGKKGKGGQKNGKGDKKKDLKEKQDSKGQQKS